MQGCPKIRGVPQCVPRCYSPVCGVPTTLCNFLTGTLRTGNYSPECVEGDFGNFALGFDRWHAGRCLGESTNARRSKCDMSDRTHETIEDMLRDVRETLNMDVAFVSKFDGDQLVFRKLEGDSESFGWQDGTGLPI